MKIGLTDYALERLQSGKYVAFASMNMNEELGWEAQQALAPLGCGAPRWDRTIQRVRAALTMGHWTRDQVERLIVGIEMAGGDRDPANACRIALGLEPVGSAYSLAQRRALVAGRERCIFY